MVSNERQKIIVAHLNGNPKNELKTEDTMNVEVQNIAKVLNIYSQLSKENRSAFLLRNLEFIKKNKEVILEFGVSKFMLESILYRNSINKVQISQKFNETFFPNGFGGGEICTISGLSGGGKTAFCVMLTACAISGINPFVDNSICDPQPVLYVSLEQRAEQIKARIVSTLSALNDLDRAVSFGDILGWNLNCRQKDLELGFTLFDLYSNNLKILPIEEFDSTPTIMEIIDKIKELMNNFHAKKPILIIDQYENVAGALNPTSDVIMTELNAFVMRENITVFLQVQLNKASITSATGKDGTIDFEKLSGNSLRGSSGIEHQSSTILFLVPENRNLNKEKDHQTIILFASKNRNGIRGSIKMNYWGAFNLFLDYEET